MDKISYLECDCYSPQHIVRITFSDVDDFFLITIHLNNNRKFWKRLIEAIKHIWGGRSIYGNYDEILLNKKEVEKLKGICQEYLNNYKD